MIAALFLLLTSLSVGARTRMALPCASAPPADDGPVLLREGGVLLRDERADGPRLWFTDSPLDEPGTLLHSDGTAESTASIPLPGAARVMLGRAGGRFVFSVADPGGETVRATDGITEDLEVLATVSGTSTPGVPLNDALYFLVESGASSVTPPDAGLWRTDGTKAGTARVVSAPLGHLVRVGSLIYFTSKVGVWRSDGTASGTMLLFPATGLLELFTAGERLVIRAWDQAFEHYTLWLSDGTPEGTIVLRTHSPAVGSYVEVSAIGNRLVWTSFDDADGTFWLWTSDGAAQLHRFRDAPVCIDTHFGPRCTQLIRLLQPLADAVLFVDNAELWRTDGTAAGTRRIATLPDLPAAAARLGGAVWLATFDLSSGDGIRTQIWSSDGSPPGTRAVAEVNGTPQALTAVDGWLALRTGDPYGGEPYRMWALTIPCAASSLPATDRARCEIRRLNDVLRCGAGEPVTALALSRSTARHLDRLLARTAMRKHARGRLLRKADRPLRKLLRRVGKLQDHGLDAECAAHLSDTIEARRTLLAALR